MRNSFWARKEAEAARAEQWEGVHSSFPGVEGLGSCGLLAGSGQKQEWAVGGQWKGTGGSWGRGVWAWSAPKG